MEPLRRKRTLPRDIVDETSLTEADGTEPAWRAILDVVDGEPGGGELGAGGGRCGRGGECAVELRRERALGGGKAGVARTHREAVGFAHGRAADDLGGEEKRGAEAAHELELLKILFTEISALGIGDLEQFRYDRQHAGEMTGPVGAAEFAAEFAFLNRIPGAVGIHLGDAWSKNDIDAGLSHEREIGIERARVFLEIVGFVELRGIDEDRGEHDDVFPSGGLKERTVAGMERAHRGDKSDAAASGAVLGSERAPRGDGVKDAGHDQKLSFVVGNFPARTAAENLLTPVLMTSAPSANFRTKRGWKSGLRPRRSLRTKT